MALSLRSSYERDVRIIVAFNLFSFSSASFLSILRLTDKETNSSGLGHPLSFQA